MNLKMTHVNVWAAEIDDKPGALARTLRAIADDGADLECVIARRQPNKPGKGLLFVSPMPGRSVGGNADQAGFRIVTDVATLRIEGADAPGIGAKMAQTIAGTGVNMHGLSAMAFGRRFVCYVGFDSVADRDKAETALEALAGHDWRFWRRSEHAHAEAATPHA